MLEIQLKTKTTTVYGARLHINGRKGDVTEA